MTKEELIKKVKVSLRVSTDNIDINGEISDLVDECLRDLQEATSYELYFENPLVLKACKAYAKANYGYDEQNEKWQQIYENIKKDFGLRANARSDM